MVGVNSRAPKVSKIIIKCFISAVVSSCVLVFDKEISPDEAVTEISFLLLLSFPMTFFELIEEFVVDRSPCNEEPQSSRIGVFILLIILGFNSAYE